MSWWAYKPEDTMRFISININGLSFWWHNNPKANQLKFILRQYRIDGMGLQEPCINWMAFKASITLASLLRSSYLLSYASVKESLPASPKS